MNHGTLIIHKGKFYRVGEDPNYQPSPLPGWVDDIKLPHRWAEIDTSTWTGTPDREYARAYRFRQSILVLMSSSCNYGKRWLHISVSRLDNVIPTWEEMSMVKCIFVGDNRQAIQVMPPAEKHINIHPGVLHLWHGIDGDGLPDFTAGGETI